MRKSSIAATSLVLAASLVPGMQATVTTEPPVQTETLQDLPDFRFRPDAYREEAYIHAAALLQAMGKEEAGQVLLRHATNNEQGGEVFVLCRMLFTHRKGEAFRRPMIGGASFLGGTQYTDWPLEPIALVDGVPFLIIRGYTVGGRPEQSVAYVQYCLDHCDWNPKVFKPKSEQQKQKALAKFLTSRKWKIPLDTEERNFFSLQLR